jgi:hypothetical protein
MVAGVCAVLIRPGRLIRAAIVLQPSTFVRFHRALVQQKYRRLFSSTVPKTPGPKGPHPDVIAAVVAMKQRNPTWGCPRIAQQITLAFGSSLDKDVVRRILAARYQPAPGSGPSWLTTLICSEMRIRHSQEDQRSIRFLRRTRQNHAPRVPWLWLRSSPAVHGRNPSHDECKRFGCAPWTLVACVQHVAIKTEPSIPKMHGYAIRVFVVDNHASRSYNGNAVA